jgi:hypothetical protein
MGFQDYERSVALEGGDRAIRIADDPIAKRLDVFKPKIVA